MVRTVDMHLLVGVINITYIYDIWYAVLCFANFSQGFYNVILFYMVYGIVNRFWFDDSKICVITEGFFSVKI